LTYRHNERRNYSPGDDPVQVRLVPGHLLDAVGKLSRAKDPSDGDGLKEAAPKDRDAARAVKVHQLEEVGTAIHGHGRAEQEEEDADGRGELPPPRAQVLGEHVHEASHQAFHDAELAVDADGLKKV
jgi:hypothetical protein